jgi:hypothetical protein
MKTFITISLLFLLSCSKQVQEVQPIEIHNGGLLPDDPIEVAKVPLIVSKGFINIAAKGKPVTNLSFVSPTDQSTVTGIVTVKTSISSNIYIDGVQVSSTGLYYWNTANAVKGFHTITASVKGTKISIIVYTETIIIVPPVDTPILSGVRLTMPPVMNQGSEGSCGAAAIGYAARSSEWFYKAGAMQTFSTEFLYNQVKFGIDCQSGTAMQTCLDFMLLNGICTNASMPYSSGDCSLLPNDQQKAEALNYKIDGYYKVYTTDKAAIKSLIDQNHPVIIGLACDQSFLDAKAGFIWKTYSGSGYLPHCVVICGYDDSKNAYLIQNSWGTTWGDAGYSWIDYDHFPTRTGTWCYAIK